MDLGVLLPAAITGLVGLAGIGGTLLSARMTSALDAKHDKVAEKRRIYANCLTLLTTGFRAAAEAHEDVLTAQMAAMNAVFEMQLIAPINVAKLAFTALEAISTSNFQADSWAVAQAQLIAAMRADLGEALK